MTCATCGDKGILRIWADSDEFMLCLCAASRWYRSDKNAGKQTGYYGWQVWAAANQVPAEKIFLLEEVLTAEELAAAGFQAPAAAEGSRESTLLAAGRMKAKAKL